MKKNLLAFMLLFSVPLYAAGQAVTAPQQATATALSGINLNLLSGAVAAVKAPAPAGIGISGFSFRFLDAGKSGFEIPFSISMTNSDIMSSSSTRFNTSFYISSGYRFIIPLFVNEFIRVNAVPGFFAGYQGSWSQYEGSSQDSDSTQAVSIGASAGMEIEVPIGRIFSLPPDTLCLASGISVSFGGGYSASFVNDRCMSGTLNFSLNSFSSGSNINALGIRYYF